MQQEDLLDQPIHTHLSVSSLLDSLILDLRLVTIRDLLDLDVSSLTNRTFETAQALSTLAADHLYKLLSCSLSSLKYFLGDIQYHRYADLSRNSRIRQC